MGGGCGGRCEMMTGAAGAAVRATVVGASRRYMARQRWLKPRGSRYRFTAQHMDGDSSDVPGLDVGWWG